jgi:hypothetical protein
MDISKFSAMPLLTEVSPTTKEKGGIKCNKGKEKG